MRILNFFRGKKAKTVKQETERATISHGDEVTRLQLLLQSPYPEDRDKALKKLRALARSDNHRIPSVECSNLGVERVILVLDRSDSMGSWDYPPSRLEAAIDAAREMIRIRVERDPRDEIGVVWFNEMAAVLHNVVRLSDGTQSLIATLGVLNPDDGTDINAGLCKARDLLRDNRAGVQNRIVLLTDGHGGEPLVTANELKAKGVVIDVIGIGGSPDTVNEVLLRLVASTINGDTRYRFIANRSELFEHFRRLADKLVK